MRHFLFSIVALMGLIAQVLAADAGNPAAAEPPPPAPYLTPEAELAKFVFQEPGYRLEPVVTDPIIKEPVVAVFDGNGRMYVAEMRSYMQDIDGNNEFVPAGRVSLHWSRNAGWESGPISFQTPIIYGAFNYNEGYGPGFAEVWPLVSLRDYEGGPPRIRPDGTLNHYTASCGQEIFRGDRLPAVLRGDLFFAEPVGRLIRRARIEVKEAFTRVYNRYDHSEFIRSTDPNFRPVNMVTAPDGTLYIVDMYRGIIQEANWVRPGSYLRPVVQQNQLDKNIGRGRIWRLVYKDSKPGPQPRMLDETPEQLVNHNEQHNGSWRDTAPKPLFLSGVKSIVHTLA